MNQEQIDTQHKTFRIGLRNLLLSFGEDPERDGLLQTPQRVLQAWGELLHGYTYTPALIRNMLKTFDSHEYNEMVVVSDIDFTSVCEHHMLPFTGVAHVGYIPDGRIVGLSKIPKLVDVFAARLQVQERMTQEISRALFDHLEPKGVAVVTTATHSCVSCRGVKKAKAKMTCSSLRGVFHESPATRAEFLGFIRSNRS